MKLQTIAMEDFELRERWTDPKFRVLPQAHLAQIQPLDVTSAKSLFEQTCHWYEEQPFTQGYFADVIATSLNPLDALDVKRVRKWLYHRGMPFKHQVFLSWGEREAAITNWKMVVKYWDDIWYPGSDDLVVFDESLSWALFFWHEEEAYFASRPLPIRHRPTVTRSLRRNRT